MGIFPSIETKIGQPRADLISSPSSPPIAIADGILIAMPLETRPTQVLLGTLSHPGFRVLAPIQVQIGCEDKTITAHWADADEFGTGESVSDACQDLGRTIAELYGALEADESKLGPDLQLVWKLLKEHVAPRR